jgi:DNA adenine methylase
LIYENYKNYSILEVAFSTLFLNRTNFSGILSSGPIGGFSQKGKYKMDCRFNVNSIIEIITILAKYRNKVKVYNFDVKELILKKLSRCQDNVFINFDPPYVIKGKELYHNSYIETDHKNLRNLIKNNVCAKWIMTYDRNNLIKNLYSKYHINTFSIKYFVNKKYVGNEYLISNFFNSDLLSSKLK